VCGIAGVCAFDSHRDITPSLERLTAALAHRGPDGFGYHFLHNRSAGFGHRRLSIVDLEGGRQPMTNEDGTLWVILNGELYNHLDLRRELEQRGHRFATQSDVEALVHGWEEWGPAVLSRVNGMYAFALFDERDRTVWLARDPIGVKPLYVGCNEIGWWFASELDAAERAGLLDRTLRDGAFDEYLVYRFIPSPGTFYERAWKLPPGHLCRLALGALPATLAFEPFSSDFSPGTLPASAGEWQEAIRDELHAAVRRQLMADVPLASLLSGGVDSTVITKVMTQELPEPPTAYAVGFGDAPNGGELAVARRAAVQLGVPLVELAVTESEYVSALPYQAGVFAEPIANAGTVLLGMLCARVRDHHKVALTGQGADEPLGGYARHAAQRFYPMARRLGPMLGVLPDALLGNDGVRRLRRAAAAGDEATRFTEILAVFSPSEAADLTGHRLDPAEAAAPVRRWLPDGETDDALNRLLRVDMRLSLADDLLTIADHTSMASSVELRVPFLDLPFVALVDQLPGKYKVSWWGERKWLYRRAVRPDLPRSLQSALLGWRARTGRKYGFSTPADSWLRRWVVTEGESFLAGPDACLPRHLRRDRLRTLLADLRNGRRRGTRQLMTLYVLEAWLRQRAS